MWPFRSSPPEAGLRIWYDTGAYFIDADEAVPLAPREVAIYAAKVAEAPGRFIGFIDAQETVIQAMNDGHDRFHVERPLPDGGGSLATVVDRDRFLAICSEISAPLADYAETLGLELEPWSQQ